MSKLEINLDNLQDGAEYCIKYGHNYMSLKPEVVLAWVKQCREDAMQHLTTLTQLMSQHCPNCDCEFKDV